MMNETLILQQRTMLAERLGDLWSQAHGQPAGKVQVLVAPDCVAVLIHDALGPAERAAARQFAGQPIIQRYAEGLLQTVQPEILAQVEAVTGQKASAIDVHADATTGHVLCFYNLDESQRAVMPT